MFEEISPNFTKIQRTKHIRWPCISCEPCCKKRECWWALHSDYITDLVQFKVIVPYRVITSPDYIDKVKVSAWVRQIPRTCSPLSSFRAHKARLPIGQQTPSTDFRSCSSFYEKLLGQSAFRIVRYVWDAATRKEHVKKPLQRFINNGRVDKKSWRKEADIMHNIFHVSIGVSAFSCLFHTDYLKSWKCIIAFWDATVSFYFQLEFEYMLKTRSTVTSFCQFSKTRRFFVNYFRPWNIFTIEILWSGTVISDLKIFFSLKEQSMTFTSSLSTSVFRSGGHPEDILRYVKMGNSRDLSQAADSMGAVNDT